MSEEKLEELYSIAFEDTSIQSEAIKNYVKQLQQENEYYKNILTEFEKWLEKYKKDEMFDYGNEQANNDFNEFCDIALNKLQKLKEGKNEESND